MSTKDRNWLIVVGMLFVLLILDHISTYNMAWKNGAAVGYQEGFNDGYTFGTKVCSSTSVMSIYQDLVDNCGSACLGLCDYNQSATAENLCVYAVDNQSNVYKIPLSKCI